jgi:hypothetical protein
MNPPQWSPSASFVVRVELHYEKETHGEVKMCE